MKKRGISAKLFVFQCLVAGAGLALLTYSGFVLKTNLLTISLLYLLIVVGVASFFGFWQATVTSIAATLLLDYFFEPPIFSFEVANSGILVALLTFEATALAISRLQGREMRRAGEAAINRLGMERLYELSRSSLLMDLHEPPGPQLVVLIHRIFGTEAVALFDMNVGRQDRMGDWSVDEEDLAKECYLHNAEATHERGDLAQRILRAGPRAVGALVIRGNLDPLVVDALASLAAIAMDRNRWIEKEERAESARKGEELRAAVMDALAHEFKTPLTAVQTASSGLLELGGLTAAQTDLVRLIDGEAVRMNELCTRLLKTAKLEKERVGLETGDVNLRELIDQVLADVGTAGEKNRVEVMQEEPALTLRADRGLLAMILTQLIDNAKKYSTPNTPIEITTRKSHSDVLIAVHNFGSSIRIDDRERIFDRFYRSPDSKKSVPGTGIGLSVVKKAAEAHHGHVWVISDDKEGTTFYLSLPMGTRRNL